jgi:hypothetical protein
MAEQSHARIEESTARRGEIIGFGDQGFLRKMSATALGLAHDSKHARAPSLSIPVSGQIVPSDLFSRGNDERLATPTQPSSGGVYVTHSSV